MGGGAVLKGFWEVPRHAWVGVHLHISWNWSSFVPKMAMGLRFLKGLEKKNESQINYKYQVINNRVIRSEVSLYRMKQHGHWMC